jgi:hypothetical protein
MYSTHSAISCGAAGAEVAVDIGVGAEQLDQVEEFVRADGVVVSSTPPQLVLTLTGRLPRGPMPSFQWYSSAKQPPGQRTSGTCKSSARRPRRCASPWCSGSSIRADPHAFVDAGAQVLGELAVDVLVDDGARLGRRRW